MYLISSSQQIWEGNFIKTNYRGSKWISERLSHLSKAYKSFHKLHCSVNSLENFPVKLCVKGKKATFKSFIDSWTTDWFQIGKGVRQGCILSPCLFNLYAEYIMRNAGLEEAQAGIKIARRNINNLRYINASLSMSHFWLSESWWCIAWY